MRTYYVPTKCGRCIECRQQRQREWIVRLSEELRENNNALFVTLTFDKRKTQEIDANILIEIGTICGKDLLKVQQDNKE